MEVMIPVHLHSETACLEGILHFFGTGVSGWGGGDKGTLIEGAGSKVTAPSSGSGRVTKGRRVGASAIGNVGTGSGWKGRPAHRRCCYGTRPGLGRGDWEVLQQLGRLLVGGAPCGTPRGQLAIGNRRPGRAGLRGSGQGILTTPPGPSRPPSFSRFLSPHCEALEKLNKIINHRLNAASYHPPTDINSMEPLCILSGHDRPLRVCLACSRDPKAGA